MSVGDQPNPGDQSNTGDMQELLQQAQQLQEQFMTAQQELAETEVQGSAGGGLVTASVTGTGELQGITIDPQAIDTGNVAETAETVADLVLAAVRAANRAAAELAEQQMGPLSQALGGGGGAPGLPGT